VTFTPQAAVTGDPDFSAAVIDELYRRRPYSLLITVMLAVVLGPAGAHRFYCGRFWSAIAMLLTLGGGLLWWVWDLFHLRRLVASANDRQRRREADGYPPRGLDFMPRRGELRLHEPPSWAAHYAGSRRITGSALLLALLGYSLGVATRISGSWEPVFVLTLFIAVSLIAARDTSLAKLPVIGALIRWVHRLRLFYHHVDPGSILSLALRPVFGVFLAPWQPKARAEVRLHLQMGGVVVLAFATVDALDLLLSDSLGAGIAAFLIQILQTLLFTYLFVAPASALLTTQLLVSRRDRVVWGLSLVTMLALGAGLSS
jgi:hypothetical protein